MITARLRLGTRASRLALAQSRAVAALVEARWPGVQVELVDIETRGDRNLDVPLWAAGDPDFFSAELDRALATGAVDFTVHSLKDLGPRPPCIRTAALPLRADPRDVVVFRADVPARIAAGAALRIGTCSRRRTRQVGAFLDFALPATGQAPRLAFHSLRGAVDARVQRIAGDGDAPDALDGVVLALAGLERLWRDGAGRAVLAPALAGARWMVLPLGECPAAPGQGVLAVECRADDARTGALLAALHDARIADQVRREQAALAAWPAALRDAAGATAVDHPVIGALTFARGPGDDGGDRRALDWAAPPPPAGARPWESTAGRDGGFAPTGIDGDALPPGPVFAAHWRAVAACGRPLERRLWVSGVASWRRLAARGQWVEGCTDELGFAGLAATLGQSVLGLPPLEQWSALTRAGAEDSWRDSGIGHVLATYRAADAAPPPPAALAGATHCWWASGDHFQRWHRLAPADAVHACGAGKTGRALAAAGVRALVFPGRDAFRAWLA